MEARAIAKTLRISPIRARLVADMIRGKNASEAFNKKDECPICSIDFKCLLLMGIATSIDALAAGVNLKLTNTPIILAAIIIGLGSFILSGCGFWLGYFLKKLPSKILGTIGGLILVFLALKSLWFNFSQIFKIIF